VVIRQSAIRGHRIKQRPAHLMLTGRWFDVIAPSKPRVVLAHGEGDQCAALARLIQQHHRLPSTLPKMGEVIEL